jgi:hypothetical protein
MEYSHMEALHSGMHLHLLHCDNNTIVVVYV